MAMYCIPWNRNRFGTQGTQWRIERLKRLQGKVYQNLVALHQLQRANQRKSYTRALRLDLEFPDLHDAEDNAGGDDGAEEENRLSLDEQVCILPPSSA